MGKPLANLRAMKRASKRLLTELKLSRIDKPWRRSWSLLGRLMTAGLPRRSMTG